MKLSLRNTKIQNLNFVISSCPSDQGEDYNIAYSFIKEVFCKVCKQSLLFSNSKYDIIEIDVIFKNKKYIKFEVPSDAKPFNHNYNNNYEYVYEDDNTLGLLLSEYKVKYKDNLFV